VAMRRSRIAVLVLTVVLLAVASGHAQAPSPALPPVPGFVPPYEILRTLRSAGFEPLAPPLREGATYVARATDYRGILMRVVLDARTGAIRDANRIVPGPGSDAQLGMLPPYEEAPDTLPPPPDFAPRDFAPRPAPVVAVFPPLPRPRPAELAAKELAARPADAAMPATMKSDVTGSVPAVAPVASPVAAAPPPAKPSRVPPPLMINN